MTATLERPEGRIRAGLKGPRAADWLTSRGLQVPANANTWLPCATGSSGEQAVLIARLGASEYFLESAAHAALPEQLASELAATRPAGVYPVLREDASFVLGGSDVHALLAQVCNVNFAALDPAARPVVMTLMVGVAVLVVPRAGASERRYWIWCDPCFGHFLRQTFETVIADGVGIHRGAA